MASGIKGITVEIGGNTAPLDKALKDVNKTTRDLQSELKSVDKALKLDPNNVTLVSQKQKILKEDISATKEKLDSLKESQKQVNEQYKNGTIDDGQYRAFQRELETTKAKLSDLKDEKKSISVIGAAFGEIKDKVTDATSKLAPFISGLKTVGKTSAEITDAGIKTVSSAVDSAEKGLKIYAGTAATAGTAIAGLTYKAAQSADDINTLSAQTGLSTEQIQKFQYASELIDVPMETLTGSMAKLTKNMAGAQDGTGSASKAFQELGVSVTDSNGQLRNNQDVFNDSITALGKIDNATERDALAMQIFGKSAQDLNPLIKGGADALKQLGNSADSAGLILSQKALNNLNGFNDSVDILKANTSQAGKVLAGTFAGGLKESTDLIGTMIPQLTGAIAQLLSGQNMETAQIKLTASLISGANQIIDNFAAQLPTFLNGFNAVIMSLVIAISAVLPTAINTILPILINGFVGLIQGLLPQVPVLLPVIINAAITLFMGLLNGLNQIIPQLLAMLPTLVQNVSDILIKNLPLIITAGIQLLTSLITGITNSIPKLIVATIALIPVITNAIVNNLPALISAGIQLIVALAEGLPKAIPAILKALPQIISAIINGLTSVNWLDVGVQIIAGIASGLWEGIKSIDFGSLGSSIVKGFKHALGIHSPSTVMRDEIGKNLSLGIVEGVNSVDFMQSISDTINQNIDKPADAIKKVADLVSEKIQNIKDTSAQEIKELNNDLSGLGSDETIALKGVSGSQKDAIKDEYNQKKQALKDEIQLRKDQADKEITEIQRIGSMNKEELQQEIADRKDFVNNINNLDSQIKDALKEKYTDDEKNQEDSINKELSNLDNWKDESEKRINDVYSIKEKDIEDSSNAQIAALQAESDALDKQTAAEDRASKQKEYTDKISDLQSQIKYEHNDYNKAELQKQLDQEQSDYEKELNSEAVSDKKDAISKQIDAIKENADNQKQLLEQQKSNELNNISSIYNAEKDNYQKRLDNLKTFYDTKLSDANINAEAEKLIMQNNQNEIVSLLNSYSDQYKQAGQTLGDRLAEGFQPAIDNIKSMIANITSEISEARDNALNAMQSANAAVLSSSMSVNDVGTTSGSTIKNEYNVSITSPVAQTPSQQTSSMVSTLQKLGFQTG